MFDFGLSEIILILMVSLVVLGPERLPKVARSLGAMLGKVRAFVGNVKADITAQIDEQELRDLGNALRDSAATLRRDMEGSMHDLEEKVSAIRHDLGSTAWQRLPEMRTPADFADDAPQASIRRKLQQKSRQRHKHTHRKPAPRPRLRARNHIRKHR